MLTIRAIMVATPHSLQEFVNFRLQYITGEERKQAQIFLERFFQAFGPGGVTTPLNNALYLFHRPQSLLIKWELIEIS
jgi:hypothetical protein